MNFRGTSSSCKSLFRLLLMTLIVLSLPFLFVLLVTTVCPSFSNLILAMSLFTAPSPGVALA